jgi:putative addiction module component (TIGR02574 family)
MIVWWYTTRTMSTLFEELERQARMLTPQEKASLARILIEELDPSSDSDVEQLWIAESERRYEAYSKGELKSVSGEVVMSRVRSRLK